ncbi:hypothetical protein [Clostridium sp.]|uniref:hypothetical protein n=1 Tax=Clostridium sp. TaxID=1506 RepID=UPI003F2FF63E
MQRKLYKSLALTLVSVSLLTNSAYATDAVFDSNKVQSTHKSSEDILRSASKPKTFTVSGRHYMNTTGSWLSSGLAYGTTDIKKTMGVHDPAGWLGAHTNLYNEATGRVAATGDWDYTTNMSSNLRRQTPKVSGKGRYYTKGTTKVYNGNGYTSVGANQSPIVIIKEMGIKISDEELKERQYLYETKQLIAAEGQNGVEGYVLESDLYNEEIQPNTPEEAVKYSLKKKIQGDRFIPLYDNDGITVIGTYKID